MTSLGVYPWAHTPATPWSAIRPWQELGRGPLATPAPPGADGPPFIAAFGAAGYDLTAVARVCFWALLALNAFLFFLQIFTSQER